MELFIQSLLNGLFFGGIFAVMALGFSLAFGVMEIIDFAVGEWLMLGAFIGYVLVQWGSVEPLAVAPVVALVFFGAGYAIQPLIQRAVTGKQASAVLMGLVFTFGVSLILRGSALSIWGFNVRSMTSAWSGINVTLGSFEFSALRAIAFIVGAVVTLLLIALLHYTKTGRAIRATAQSETTARLLGVDVGKIRSLVYALYASLSGVAGVFAGVLFSISAEMGVQYTTFIFFIVVLAGMGYTQGVIFAAVFLGITQSLVTVYLGGQYVHLLVFLILYVVLLIAPKGLLGRGM